MYISNILAHQAGDRAPVADSAAQMEIDPAYLERIGASEHLAGWQEMAKASAGEINAGS